MMTSIYSRAAATERRERAPALTFIMQVIEKKREIERWSYLVCLIDLSIANIKDTEQEDTIPWLPLTWNCLVVTWITQFKSCSTTLL